MTCPPLSIVTSDQLRVAWPKVRARIDKLAEGEPWSMEDVFHECVVGNAYLWTTPRLDGFVVLQIAATAYSRELNVWIAVNSSKVGAAAYWEQLKEIARSNNCQRVTFECSRRGFERLVPGLAVRFHYSEGV